MYSHEYNADNLQEKINAYMSALISYNKTQKIVQIREKRLLI